MKDTTVVMVVVGLTFSIVHSKNARVYDALESQNWERVSRGPQGREVTPCGMWGWGWGLLGEVNKGVMGKGMFKVGLIRGYARGRS